MYRRQYVSVVPADVQVESNKDRWPLTPREYAQLWEYNVRDVVQVKILRVWKQVSCVYKPLCV